jgi:class 3 adenylate cyclase
LTIGAEDAAVPELSTRSLNSPDETIRFPLSVVDVVELGDWTVSRTVLDPGWRWSTHVRPLVGGDWCQARHVGVVVAGRARITLPDGTSVELGPNDVYEVPPGHDGQVLGDEQYVFVEWSGTRAFAGFRTGVRSKVLSTLLFADICDSAALAARLGDGAWRDVLSTFYESARAGLERYRGREVKTTGEGMLATFEGPAQALHFAAELRQRAAGNSVHVRVGVHIGEVELVGADLRGAAVQEAAAIKNGAGTDEIMASETTRTLAQASGLAFEDRGEVELPGLNEKRRLFAYIGPADAR